MIKKERLQLKLDIDTSEGVRNLTALQEKYDILIQKNKEAKGDDKATTARDAIQAKAALDKERESLGLIGLTLKELRQLQRELNAEKNRYNEGTDQYNKANAQLNQTKARIKELTTAQHSYDAELKHTIQTQGIEKSSLTQLREYYKLLRKEIDDTTDSSSEAAKKRIAESQATKALIDKKEGEISGTTSFFGQIKSQLPSAVAGAFGGMFVGLAGMIGEAVIGAFSSAIDSIKKRARDITDIEVSLNTTRANATKIKSDLNDIKTESSVDELKKLVVAAGDLNVAEKDIKAFVTEADKIAVVMGSEFGGSAEEAITMIAKLKGEFKETREQNFPEAIAKIGSTLKQLNLDGPASVPGITDFLKRVGAIPDAIKPTLPQLAAFGAVFEEANLSAEIAGSGFSKILTVAANNAALFGKQMGMTKKEIENLINTDPNQFVIKFAQSLKGLSGTDTAKSLKAVGLASDEVLKVVGVLSDNIGKLTEKQKSANQTFKDGTLTTEIFNKYLDDEAGKISQIGKAWSRVGANITAFLAKVSGPTILWLANMSEKSKSVVDTFEEQHQKLKKLESTMPGLITRYKELTKDGQLTATAQQELNNVMGQIGNVVPQAIADYDNLGRAMKINLGMVDEYMRKLKQTHNDAKNELIIARRKEIADNGAHIKAIQEQLKTGKVMDYGFGDRAGNPTKARPITDDEIRKNQADLANYKKANKELWESYKLLYSERDINAKPTTTVEPPKPADDIKFEDDKDADSKAKAAAEKAKREAEAKQKWLDESTRQSLELEAKLAFEELQATADAEEKRINQVNYNAENELKRISEQFKNQRGIVLKESQLSAEQKDLIQRERLTIERKQEEEVVAIYEEFAQKRQAQILEQTNRAIQIAQTAHAQQLQNNLKTAQTKGTSQDVFNAQENIIFNKSTTDLANLKIRYDKERESLKDNKEALKQLEVNYGNEKSAIINQQIADWEALIGDFYTKDLDRKKKANFEKLKLDISEAELNNSDPKTAKIALLNAEMQAELSVKDLTELEKTNILRRYAQEREGIERSSFQTIMSEVADLYSQVYSGITNALRSELQSRETAENEKYNSQKQKVQDLEDSGTYSKAKAKAEQTKIDKAHNRELSKIKYEQAKIDKAANISQATINGIQAVMKAYAQTGILGGPIAAAIIGGVTAYQIGKIIEQPLPKVEGSLFDGGATPSVFQNPVDNKGGGLIIAHPDEYMIPKWLRQTQYFANIEPILEYSRLTKTPPPAYIDGGSVLSNRAATPVNPNNFNNSADATLVELLKENTTVMRELREAFLDFDVVIGHEAADKILKTANETKSFKQNASAL